MRSSYPPRAALRGVASQRMLALFFVVAGILHFVFPQAYMHVMPSWLGWHAALVAVSGVAEISGGIGVLPPFCRRAAGWGLLALCLAVLPANVQMLQDGLAAGKPAWLLVLLVLRLPLQGLLMAWIWHATDLGRVKPRH